MTSKTEQPKRLNRTVSVSEAITKALDPVFQRRGFASRDIVARWADIAPHPYDKVAAPDRLTWPRGEAGAEGATLYLRCAASHALALAHEETAIAGAINRYFGYVLVGRVRMAAEPFRPGSPEKRQSEVQLEPQEKARIDRAVADIRDDGVRSALSRLGQGMARRRKRD